MTHNNFTHRKKNDRNKYLGSWSETESRMIDLPFSVASMKAVLAWGANPKESQYTHQDIAHWCDRFRMAMFDIDTSNSMDIATGIAADIDAQWDMYLANSYSLEELNQLDFSKERMPVKWFKDWLEQINKA